MPGVAPRKRKIDCRALPVGPHPPPDPLLPPTNTRERGSGFRMTTALWGKEGEESVARAVLEKAMFLRAF